MPNLRTLLPAVLLTVMATSACRLDMHVQPRFNPLARNDFFADQRSARPPVEGTVARGQLERRYLLLYGQNRRQSWRLLPHASR